MFVVIRNQRLTFVNEETKNLLGCRNATRNISFRKFTKLEGIVVLQAYATNGVHCFLHNKRKERFLTRSGREALGQCFSKLPRKAPESCAVKLKKKWNRLKNTVLGHTLSRALITGHIHKWTTQVKQACEDSGLPAETNYILLSPWSNTVLTPRSPLTWPPSLYIHAAVGSKLKFVTNEKCPHNKNTKQNPRLKTIWHTVKISSTRTWQKQED